MANTRFGVDIDGTAPWRLLNTAKFLATAVLIGNCSEENLDQFTHTYALG